MRLLFLSFFLFIAATSLAQKYYHTFNWSPDSKKILYCLEEYREDKSTSQILLMNADGSDRRIVIKDGWSPAWSSDGKNIVYTAGSGKASEIFISKADGSSPRQLTSNLSSDREPSVSPDGRKIVFDSDRDGKNRLFWMSIDGSSQEPLPGGLENTYTPTWSGDGRTIVFFCDIGDHMDKVYLYYVDGGKVQLITDDDQHNFYPSWTPDGEILFSSGPGRQTGGDSELFIIKPGNDIPRKLGVLSAWYARMSPDGKTIAYTKMYDTPVNDYGDEIYVSKPDGSKSSCITCK